MAIPALMSDEVRLLACEHSEGKEAEVGSKDGYAYRGIRYGEVAMYRLLAFGYPNTTAIIATQPPVGVEDN